MKKILILILLIIAGYAIFNINKGGLRVNLVEAIINNSQANTTKILQGNNPSLERTIVNGTDSLVFKAKMIVENREKTDMSFSLFDPSGTLGELSKTTKGNSGSWASRLKESYELAPISSKTVTITKDSDNTNINGLKITAKANTKETYTVKIVFKVSDIADGTYVMRLHGKNGGYIVEGSSDRIVKSISTNYSNTVEIKRVTQTAVIPPASTGNQSATVNSAINIEPISSQLNIYDLTRSTYGVEAVFKTKITPTVDINTGAIIVNVDFYDSSTQRMIASVRGNITTPNNTTVIKKGVVQEVEIVGRYSGYVSSLVKGGVYNAKISSIVVDPVNNGTKIIKDKGLERFVTNNLTYSIDTNRETIFETPKKGTVWKKSQTNVITIKGYTGLIKDGETFNFIKNDVNFIQNKDYQIVFFSAGSFVKGQSSYNITIPKTLKTGEYYFRIGDSKSEVFTITE